MNTGADRGLFTIDSSVAECITPLIIDSPAECNDCYIPAVQIETVNIHNALQGLQGGQNGQYYHLTQIQYTAVLNSNSPSGSNAFATLADITNVTYGFSSGLTTNGTSITFGGPLLADTNIDANGSRLTWADNVNAQGMGYTDDYSANGITTFGDRWITDAGWVNAQIASASSFTFSNGLTNTAGVVTLGGTYDAQTVILNQGEFNTHFHGTFFSGAEVMDLILGYEYPNTSTPFSLSLQSTISTNGFPPVGTMLQISQGSYFYSTSKNSNGDNFAIAIDPYRSFSMQISDTINNQGMQYADNFATYFATNDRSIPDVGYTKLVAAEFNKYKGDWVSGVTLLEGDMVGTAYFGLYTALTNISGAANVLDPRGVTDTGYSYNSSDATNIASYNTWTTMVSNFGANSDLFLHLSLNISSTNNSTFPAFTMQRSAQFDNWIEWTIGVDNNYDNAQGDGYFARYRFSMLSCPQDGNWYEVKPYLKDGNAAVSAGASSTFIPHMDVAYNVSVHSYEFRVRTELLAGNPGRTEGITLDFMKSWCRWYYFSVSLYNQPVIPSSYWPTKDGGTDPNTILAHWNGTDTGTITPIAGTTTFGDLITTSDGSSILPNTGGGITFASLPTPKRGMLRTITDSTTNTWGATITGTGANIVLGYYNGTNWTVAAK